ncbi:unnamed protein product [Gongylonema pulchrum]|uniref:Uncharacterized protein n=1 Tax=Gongylonema pulchrum TaxID=637853 RepID=A0A3P7RLA8_9BILA|nr:unnamed protein product [Gongylonema pulchrum]
MKNTGGGLNGTIQQMVLKCVFDDETIPVKAVDESTPICYLSLDIPNRILHPFFGCTRRERHLKASLYTTIDEMSTIFEHKCINDFRHFAKLTVNRILHPFFGCTRRERHLKASLYTTIDEMSTIFEHKCINDFRHFAKLTGIFDLVIMDRLFYFDEKAGVGLKISAILL